MQWRFYQCTDIQFWVHMRSQISKPMLLSTWFSTNKDPFNDSTLVNPKYARFSETFHSELSVVSAKRSLVSNNIESKSYSSPILHSVRVFKIYVWMHVRKNKVSFRRLFWVPTKHCILKTMPYIRDLMCHKFYSTYANASMYQGSSCRCFSL